MSTDHDPLRRTVIAALASAPLLSLADAQGASETPRSGSRILVAYFSRSGNTRVVAGLIQRGLGADLFEIRPAHAYPEDYLQTVEQARQERDSGFEPELQNTVHALSDYDTIYLGFPIWGETAPPIVRAFLSAHELTGKTLIPFNTHGGYGLGNSRRVLVKHAPKAKVLEGFVMEGEQERKTMERVNGWLKDHPLTH
ncbi:twin-arginine translocation pathway signal [Pseudomonas sp. Ag1]|jgi:flavodoxin|uniref:flavodoxin n=1 Tax=Pseudomonas sp. Ag1 TaxID=1197727 RepID=UPI000272C967|nr:flavodoxin [Pseudomonas sp. Ag1]EJF72620.1 twin-arginine translocation pathway signal [Pseudomonas sp. Ag1]